MRRILLFPVVFTLLAGCASTGAVLDEFSSADVTPRLQNNEPERRGAVINAAAFNDGSLASTISTYTGFVGPLRVDYSADRSQIVKDLNSLGPLVPREFNPNETVTVDFRDASLNYILDQLLGGALGVNFVAPRGLPSGIDFRTEQPLPKSRVLQVVRDLLSRSGLVMRLSNGVYHIGSEAEVAAIEVNSAVGRSGEELTRVVKLERDNAARVVELASLLIPPTASVVVSSASNTIVVRANPNDLDSIQNLLTTLSGLAFGTESMAIVPLRRSAPTQVAAQLTEFFSPSLRGNERPVTVIPLETQNAILVRADSSIMTTVRQVTAQLDRSVTDVSDLRVITLKHLRAQDIAPQLSAAFAPGAAQTPRMPAVPASAEEARASTGVRARLRPPRVQPPSDNADGTGLAVPMPPLSPAGAGGAQQAEDLQTAAVLPGDETRIVADERSNTLLVHSTYTVFKRMRDVVEMLDIPQAQVVIEATVIEVVLNDRLEAGVQFFLQSNGIVVGSGVPSGSAAPAEGGIIGVSTSIGNVTVDAVVKALRAVTALKVVSSPYLTVVDRETARLVIGDQIPFASTSQTSSSGGTVTVTQDVEILDTGVVLEITPTVNANNSVNLAIVQSVSSPVSNSSADGLTPTIATRDISSHILAQSGRTVLLGGLIQDRIEKGRAGVPGASRVPVLGGLFRQDAAAARRTELLVLITPRVVRASSELETITRQLRGARGTMATGGDLKAR